MKNLKNVQTIAKVISVISLIGMIFCYIGVGACIFAGALLIAMPKIDNLAEFALEYSMVELQEATLGLDVSTTQLGFFVLAAAVLCAGAAVGITLFYRYTKHELEDGTPFTYRGADELMKVGIISIVAPICALIIAGIISIFAGPINSSTSNSVSLTGGICMILLSFLFRYGAELEEKARQNEAFDENSSKE